MCATSFMALLHDIPTVYQQPFPSGVTQRQLHTQHIILPYCLHGLCSGHSHRSTLENAHICSTTSVLPNTFYTNDDHTQHGLST